MNGNQKSSSLELHSFLRDEREAILHAWRELTDERIPASRDLSDEEQRNRMPELLESIASSAEETRYSPALTPLPQMWPKHHAEQRWDLGFTLEEMTREYGLLRVVIFRMLAPRLNEISSAEILFLNQALDESVVEGVIHYVSKATHHLESEQERLEVTLQSIGDGVVSTDIDGIIDYLNPAAQRILGWSIDKAVGQRVNEVMITLDEQTKERLDCAAMDALKHDQVMQFTNDILLQRADGKLIPAEETAAPLKNASGEIMGAVTTFRDISTLRSLTQRLGYLTAHDALTGLPNRALLVDRFYQALAHAERHERRVGLFYLDLDQFKDINDTVGHPMGDELLKQVGKRIVSCIRRTDTACRVGSDEFVVLLSEVVDVDYLKLLCEKLHECIRQPFEIPDRTVNLSTSLGISVYPADGHDPHTLIKHAETAMHQAKAEGRDIGKFFAPIMNHQAEERRQLETELSRALSAGQLSLNFQPQILRSSGAAVGAEALLQWNHPQLGQVPPGRFIPVAENRRELMLEIGDWVLEEACRQAKAWQDAGHAPVRISVNVSIVQLQSDTLLNRIAELLQRYQLPPEQLQLELTESILMTAIAGAGDQVRAIKALGVDISVDDFGTGYSSLSYLQDLPVDELKIDQSFLRGVVNNQEKTAIVRAIILLGQDLHIRVLAEGVEDQPTLDFLAENGCEHIQGFYYSRAVPPAIFESNYLNRLQ